MAEAVGLVASILGIVGAATKLSMGLYQIASAFKEAGNEIRLIATDTSLFSRILKELGLMLRRGSNLTWKATAIAEDLMHICETVQKDGELLLRILAPIVKQSRTRFRSAMVRIRWLFERSKFIYHRQTLSSLKLSLQLYISVIHMSQEPDLDMKQMYLITKTTLGPYAC